MNKFTISLFLYRNDAMNKITSNQKKKKQTKGKKKQRIKKNYGEIT